MTDNWASVAFYDCHLENALVETILDVCEETGIAVDDRREEEASGVTDAEREFHLPFLSKGVRISTFSTEDVDHSYPDVSVGLQESIFPRDFADEREYCEWFDSVLELTCRLAMALEAQYVPLFGSLDRKHHVIPSGLPLSDTVDQLPVLGVFSPPLVEELGGINAMYDEIWYAAELSDGHVLVIESASPWSGAGWEPPTDADYIDHVITH